MNAIEKVTGPCVVLAGAGTGKTYAIVEKVKHIALSKVYDLEKVVCITFSNEAANNLVLRIDRVLKDCGIVKRPIIRTFHGFSADLLRKYGEKVGINPEFNILDSDEAKVVLHRNFSIKPVYCHKYISTIGTAKDLGIAIEEFEKYLGVGKKDFEGVDLERRLENLRFELQTQYLSKLKDKKELMNQIDRISELIELKKFVSLWKAYEKIKEKKNYQDYSDLNKNALELVKKFPEIASEFEYFIVDEFQDTNKIQLDFLISLVKDRNITVVGDLNQSIYRFRGAYRKNIDLFKKSFNVERQDIFNLDKSYRSSNKILKTAHKLICNNYKNPEDCFFVANIHNREGEKISVYEMKNGKEEARKIVELIEKEISSGTPEEEVCVMFRTHQQSRIVKQLLEWKGIDYASVNKQGLMKQNSIKIVVDYMRILNNLKKKEKGGEQEWWDLVYHLGFPREDLIKIGKFIKTTKKDLEEGCLSVKLFNSLVSLDLSSDGKIAVKVLIERLKLLLQSSDTNLGELTKQVFNVSGLINGQKSMEDKEVMMNLNKFYELARMHESFYDSDLSNFLYYLEVLDTLGIEIPAAELEAKGVRIMTSHATKGLEYKTVIITNLAQKRFPVESYRKNGLIPTCLLPEVKEEISDLGREGQERYVEDYERYNQLLEERRLAYVSFTRAKEKLILTFSKDYGGRKFYPSQFLKEIDFQNNQDISVGIDLEEKYETPELEIKSGNEFANLKEGDFETKLAELVGNSNVEKSQRSFSPSALLLFEECQKKFEYKYVYNMPDKKTVYWEEMRLGSFVHLILEQGVKKGFTKVEEFQDLAKSLAMEEDWDGVDLIVAENLIKVFFVRNVGKYNAKSKTEQYLSLNLAGMDFKGFADRIDFEDSGARIVDYKTGKAAITPRHRNWQLGFYALAAKEKYGKVKSVVLDMLKQEKPLEFEIDDKGEARAINSDRMSGFNIYEVEQELIKGAHEIQEAYRSGFKACSADKNCEFCNEYVYGL